MDGETDTLIGWSLRMGLSPALISKRLRDGWSERDAVTTPRERAYRLKGRDEAAIAKRDERPRRSSSRTAK